MPLYSFNRGEIYSCNRGEIYSFACRVYWEVLKCIPPVGMVEEINKTPLADE